ncbi:hypothetical protein [Heyndrickxia acidiproducens]|uniref:hypothetical protein n=1 Tax=Heyndrickxia acidiproducens TaxID=1121084 RepID=UPI00036A9597|nr:hypothetical protein [Heyndrickxia acidiproducens]
MYEFYQYPYPGFDYNQQGQLNVDDPYRQLQLPQFQRLERRIERLERQNERQDREIQQLQRRLQRVNQRVRVLENRLQIPFTPYDDGF